MIEKIILSIKTWISTLVDIFSIIGESQLHTSIRDNDENPH